MAVRLAGIGLLAAALYAAGRLHSPDYTFSLFGQTGLAAVTLKSLLAPVVLGLARCKYRPYTPSQTRPVPGDHRCRV